MLKNIVIFTSFLCFFGIFATFCAAKNLEPYKDSNELMKDLRKNMALAAKVQNISKDDKKRYEMLGKTIAAQGIICKRSEISQFVIVQKAFETLRHQYGEINSDYIAFTEACRSMFGLYR